MNPIGEKSCDDESKRCEESIFFNYNIEYGTKIKVVKYLIHIVLLLMMIQHKENRI